MSLIVKESELPFIFVESKFFNENKQKDENGEYYVKVDAPKPDDDKYDNPYFKIKERIIWYGKQDSQGNYSSLKLLNPIFQINHDKFEKMINFSAITDFMDIQYVFCDLFYLCNYWKLERLPVRVYDNFLKWLGYPDKKIDPTLIYIASFKSAVKTAYNDCKHNPVYNKFWELYLYAYYTTNSLRNTLMVTSSFINDIQFMNYLKSKSIPFKFNPECVCNMNYKTAVYVLKNSIVSKFTLNHIIKKFNIPDDILLSYYDKIYEQSIGLFKKRKAYYNKNGNDLDWKEKELLKRLCDIRGFMATNKTFVDLKKENKQIIT